MARFEHWVTPALSVNVILTGGLPPVGTLDLDVFNYEGGSFVASGETEAVSILSGQLDLTSGAPGSSRMVIAKTAPTPSILSLKMIGPCSGTAFDVSVACPAGLTAFDASLPFISSTLACAAPIGQVYYVSHVTGAAGVLGLNDLVFDDSFGQYKLAAGYYRTNDAGANTWFQVDIYGVIRAFGICSGGGATFTAAVGADAGSACEGGVPIEVVGDDANFCDCTQFTSVAFEEYASGVYYLSYGGYSIAIAVTAGSSVAIVEGPCVACAAVSSVTGVNGYMEPCIGGTIDDHMGASVVLDQAVTVDTQFDVVINYTDPMGTCNIGSMSLQNLTVEILAGNISSNFQACTYGAYIPSGALICSACIMSCTNPDVDFGAVSC